MKRYDKLEDFKWPAKSFDWYKTDNWCEVYSNFISGESYSAYSNPDEIDPSLLSATELFEWDDIPYDYMEFFGTPDIAGQSVELDIDELLQKSKEFKEVIEAMEDDSFPLMQEYLGIKSYLGELRLKNQKIEESDSLFDD